MKHGRLSKNINCVYEAVIMAAVSLKDICAVVHMFEILYIRKGMGKLIMKIIFGYMFKI